MHVLCYTMKIQYELTVAKDLTLLTELLCDLGVAADLSDGFDEVDAGILGLRFILLFSSSGFFGTWL